MAAARAVEKAGSTVAKMDREKGVHLELPSVYLKAVGWADGMAAKKARWLVEPKAG